MGPRILVLVLILPASAGCGETEYRSVEDAVCGLEDGGRHARIQAARYLADEGAADPDGSAVKALAHAIHDDEPWVRRWATEALGNVELDPAVAVPALVATLGDESPAIRVAAAHSLGLLSPGDAAAIRALVRVVAEEDGLSRRVAGWALGEIGKPARAAATAVVDRLDRRARERLFMSLPVVTGAGELRFDGGWGEDVLVCVDSRAHIYIDERRHDLLTLACHLALRADTDRNQVSPRTSRIRVILALDEDLPWAAARAVLGVLVHPEVRIDRVAMAVLRAEDSSARRALHDVGALRVLAPHAPMYGPDEAPEPDPEPGAVLRLPGLSRDDLAARLRALYLRDPTTGVALRPDPAVPVRRVLEVAATMRHVITGLNITGYEIHLDDVPVLPVRDLPAPRRAHLGGDPTPIEDAPLLVKMLEDARHPVGDGYELTGGPR